MKSRIDIAENLISNVVDKYESDLEKKSNVKLGKKELGVIIKGQHQGSLW